MLTGPEEKTGNEAALRVLTGPEEKTGNETALRDDVFERLSPDDLQNLASAVANANRLGDLPAGRSPAEGLGDLILASQQKTRDEMQRLIDQARSSTLLGNARQGPLMIPDLHTPDSGSMPGNRTAAASEQAAEHIEAGLLLWQQQLEADKQAAAESKAQSEENIAVARKSQRIAQWSMWITIVVAVITVGQSFWSTKDGDEERAKQEETARLRHEATIQVLREQLSAQQQLISQKSPTPPKKSKASKN